MVNLRDQQAHTKFSRSCSVYLHAREPTSTGYSRLLRHFFPNCFQQSCSLQKRPSGSARNTLKKKKKRLKLTHGRFTKRVGSLCLEWNKPSLNASGAQSRTRSPKSPPSLFWPSATMERATPVRSTEAVLPPLPPLLPRRTRLRTTLKAPTASRRRRRTATPFRTASTAAPLSVTTKTQIAAAVQCAG